MVGSPRASDWVTRPRLPVAGRSALKMIEARSPITRRAPRRAHAAQYRGLEGRPWIILEASGAPDDPRHRVLLRDGDAGGRDHPCPRGSVSPTNSSRSRWPARRCPARHGHERDAACRRRSVCGDRRLRCAAVLRSMYPSLRLPQLFFWHRLRAKALTTKARRESGLPVNMAQRANASIDGARRTMRAHLKKRPSGANGPAQPGARRARVEADTELLRRSERSWRTTSRSTVWANGSAANTASGQTHGPRARA
jgi:hypothetical protein